MWNNCYKGKQGWGLMETEDRFWYHHGQGGFLGAHKVLVLAQNTEWGWMPKCTDWQLMGADW